LKRILVLGCGNRFFGDDGFGPEVVDHFLKSHPVPEHTEILDAGTSVRNLLFDIILGEERPEKIVIIDAVDAGRNPGEVFELQLSEIPHKNLDNFCMHSLPTSNLLLELQQYCGVEVQVISAQVESIPDCVRPGLSPPMLRAVPEVCARIMDAIQPSARISHQ